ncbi:MAG: hypothetical protein IKJ32_04130 [Clostridia bacterium]|nr:hypothetical protein [Clostridia bacterium]
MSSFWLKITAVILMLIDHIGLLFFPAKLLFRYIGRISFPIFAFQIIKGFEHTKSREKYILRMLLLTIIAQIPSIMFLKVAVPNAAFSLNIGATFTVGLLLLYVIEEVNPWAFKIPLFALITAITLFIPFEYGWFGISLILILYLFKDSKIVLGFVYACLLGLYCYSKKSLFPLPAICALLPIFLYNGKQGPKVKYLFYTFYPVHFIILLAIRSVIA